MNKIKLNEILNLAGLENVKVRFNIMFGGNWNPIEVFQSKNIQQLLDGHYWNYENKKSYKEGQITVGLIRIKGDLWLLFHVGRITKDLDRLNGVGYEYQTLTVYEKYFGRL